MTRKSMLTALDRGSYFSIASGAVLILLFEILASLVLLKIALIMFAASFLMLLVLCVMKLYFMLHETKEGEELLVDGTKEKKLWIILKLVVAAVLFTTMIAFLCVY